MKVKVAICGKMASGKTTLADALINGLGFEKFSLARPVKDFAHFLFDIPQGFKDREKFQKVGDGARKTLYADIWIDVLKGRVAEAESNFAVVDDVRYQNEVVKLKSAGWVLVKIDISDDLQIERLKKTYPDNGESHADSRNHPSEAEVDTIDDNLFDLVIPAEDTDIPIKTLLSFVCGDEQTPLTIKN